MIIGAMVPVVCYRSFWFGTGTVDAHNRNIDIRKRYVTDNLPQLHTPLLRLIGHRPIYRGRIKIGYDKPAYPLNIPTLSLVV